ncbi:MAG: hypothetical protein HY782_02230 [Chloroflexi bacterium]|nr:hypothetical protein [Chloroflexota bacterium]
MIDPVLFFLAVLAVGLVLTGFYFFLRETIADAIALHEKRKAQEEERERRKRNWR